MVVATPTAPIAADARAEYLAEFERLARELPAEPAGVTALRRLAIERFAELGFPTGRQEEWRFINLAPVARSRFVRPRGPATLGQAAVEPWRFAAAAELVFVDGRFAPELSRAGELPGGAYAGSLAEALARHPELVEPALGQHASFQQHPFAALNTALFADGAFVRVPRGVVVERPIHLLYLSTGSAGIAGAGEPTVSFPRTLVIAGESAQATVVETFAGPEGSVYFTCPVTEIVAGANASIDHYKVQRESREAFHLATFHVATDRDTTASSHSISLGGGLVRNDVIAVLGGQGGDVILNGLYLADGRQVVDNHMRVEHAAPHCGSHELYKGILDGQARAVFNGLIHVHPGAQKTDAKQSNRNLLLSRDAIANSNPQLEIYADDVKCTHGSTVGQLDEDAVFYLRSRGIGQEAARSLLTWAFASDIVERIKVEPVRHDLEEFLFTRLPKGEVVRQAV